MLSKSSCWIIQFLDKVIYMPAVVFSSVPVVLCNGIPQVQFVDGYDVPVIMRNRVHYRVACSFSGFF